MKFEIYETSVASVINGNHLRWEWHWRLRASNGRVVADGAEGYATKSGCRKAIHRICASIIHRGSVPPIVEVES